MPQIIPAGYAAVSLPIRNVSLTRTAYITWGVANSDDRDANTLAAAAQLHFTQNFVGALDSNCTIGQARVNLGQGTGVPPLVGFSGLSVNGTRAMDSINPILALRARRQTGAGGRRNRSEIYVPWCVNRTEVGENGAISTPLVNTMQPRFDDWVADAAAGGAPLYILHGDGISETPPPTPITGMQVVPQISHQVRRLPSLSL